MVIFDPHAYLDTFTNFEAKLHHIQKADFDLSRMAELLGRLGDPQKAVKIIHVAGTKGKGSTCAFLAHALAAAGYKTGLFTSPHVHHVNERIRILDTGILQTTKYFYGAISDPDLSAATSALVPHIQDMVSGGSFLTYFEVLTGVMLYYFAQQRVDIAVIETGLGGRLDATNVPDSLVAVLTPISIDHGHILGTTLSRIASEKAGIIKRPGQHVVIAPQPPEAMGVILERCRTLGAAVTCIDDKVKWKYPLPLQGEHQILNAAVAGAVVELLNNAGFTIAKSAVEQGFAKTRWPGRFEVIRKDPAVIVDCAHNPAAVNALAQTVCQQYPAKGIILVFGASADKDVQGMCRIWAPLVKAVFLTQVKHSRAHVFDAAQAAALFPGGKVMIINNAKEAMIAAFKATTTQDVLVLSGTTFLVAQARELWCTNIRD